MGKIVTAILAISVVAIIAVAALLFPDQLSTGKFWLNVGWLIVLVTLNWAVSAGILFMSNESGKSSVIAILPSAHVVIYAYSIASGTLLLRSILSDYVGFSNTWHLIVQILLAAGTAIIVLSMFLAAKGAETKSMPPEVRSKDELVNLLKHAELLVKPINDNEAATLKRIVEQIKYSLPSYFDGSKLVLYNELVTSCDNLLAAYKTDQFDQQSNISEIELMVGRLK